MLSQRCDLCGVAARGLCAPCRLALPAAEPCDLRPDLDELYSVFAYVDSGIDLLRSCKFMPRRAALGPLAGALSSVVANRHPEIDVVVAVPAHVARIRSRGFDLPAALAQRIGRSLGVRVATPLRRTDSGSQRGRARTERRSAIGYEATQPCSGVVLLVDDVVTTGTTLSVCARALRSAAAVSVVGAVLAVTPRRNAGVEAIPADTVSV